MVSIKSAAGQSYWWGMNHGQQEPELRNMPKNKHLRVLSVSRGFEDYIIEFANSLSSHVDLHLVVTSKDEWITASLAPNVQVFYSNAPRVSSLANIGALLRITRYIKQVSPDVIHIQSGASWELALKVLFPRIPLVVTMHDLTKHPSWSEQSLKFRFQQWMLDLAIFFATALIVHGEYLAAMAHELCRKRGLSRTITSIPHGTISRYGNGVSRVHLESPGNVLFFGSLNKYKGVEYLVMAEPLIRNAIPGVTIHIEGHTDQKAYYQGLIKPESKIRLILGRADDRRVFELFRWADVIVLPYIEASQSGVLQLAMAFCIPPVVTQVGGLPEVVSNGISGLVVPPSDAEALADAIIQLLTDFALRDRVIQAQKEARSGRYAWANIAQETLNLYLQVLQCPPNKSRQIV